MKQEDSEKSAPETPPTSVKPLAAATPRWRQIPWWAVSIGLHFVAIFLVSLITWTVVKDNSHFVVTDTTLLTPEKPTQGNGQAAPQEVLQSSHDTPPTDPTSSEALDLVIPPDILAKAELGDHFESISADVPDTHAAFGNPDANLFHSINGNADSSGGGGTNGASLEEVLGVGGQIQSGRGTGGGWGGGSGTGIGVNSGVGRGSFGNRNGSGRRVMIKRHGGNSSGESFARRSTNDALQLPGVNSALCWLAANQAPDGRWNCREHKGKSYDTAVTGLALLAFLRAGQSDTSGRYQKNVQRAMDWLKSQQHANGQMTDSGDKSAYSHAIAGLSLAEAAKLSKDASVRRAAEGALRWSCNESQPADAWNAWRYAGPVRDGDLSVTGWYLLQLNSAREAGLDVPDTALQKARQFVSSVASRSETGDMIYRYRPGGTSNARLNAIGGVCCNLLGMQNSASGSDFAATLEADKPDLYGWYYGSLYGAQQRNGDWPRLNRLVQQKLTASQNRSGPARGSWDPAGEYSDQWGRVGQTALGVLCLETLHGLSPAAQVAAAATPKDVARADQAPAPDAASVPAAEPGSGELYEQLTESGFTVTQGDDALSTFAIDVDTASYSNVRRILRSGMRPPKGAVRIEEMINYFPYTYEAPNDGSAFAVHCEIADCPWEAQHRLALVNLKGREIPWDQRPESNLVFLIDVSGSMNAENRLPLVKKSLNMLVDRLGAKDSVGIVIYAGETGVRLQPTACDHKAEIKSVIDGLGAGGGTNGGAGIVEAYRLASEHFIKGGTNRVILCTDGDFNLGISNQEGLHALITEKAKSGVFLTIMGFGMGNLKDSTLEMLADKGNGNYGYIDNEGEANKIFVNQIGGTLITICKDVKIQVEFNPAAVTAWRLVGYENRVMAAKEFRDDKKDAGELGSGHTVTALYEIVPGSSGLAGKGSMPLKYQKDGDLSPDAEGGDLFTVYVRHKLPEAEQATEMNVPFVDKGANWKNTSANFRWAAAVAMFGMQLRGSEHKGACDWPLIRKTAEESLGTDPGGYRAEFLELIGRAQGVSVQPIPADRDF